MISVLKHAARHCLCPTPYENDCVKCIEHHVVHRKKVTEVARAVSENLIYMDNYNHTVLLPRGDTILEYSRGNYAVPTEEEDE